jgi:chorismate lyase/3-hydroxybenzoate synthase
MTQRVIAEHSSQDFTNSLRVEIASSTDLAALLKQDDILMLVDFSGDTKLNQEDPRLVSVGLNALERDATVEVWRGEGPVACHHDGRLYWCENDDLLIGHMPIEESASSDLDAQIESAYSEINAFLRSTSFSHIFRFWNYIPGINKIENGVERYQSFCIGRHAAWSLQPDFEQTLPAASAVGTGVPGLLISFVAGTNETYQLENPRQISAFHYPPAYSPRSPLFSRAVRMVSEGNDIHQLYVSGTASIVGHKTRHAGDIKAQAEETCKNIDALLGRFASIIGNADGGKISVDSLRVYLRDERQYEIVREILSSKQLTRDNVVYLKADICRADLLLEVEGVFSYRECNTTG